MAPSHSELYVNLAFLPQWALLGLAAGGVARRLGARRHWPLAAFAVLSLPAVLRFAATPYVDILTAAGLLAAAYFGLRWLREPAWGEALLAGGGLGIAAGTKVLGALYALALGFALVAFARGGWRRRLPQLGAPPLLAAAVLGGGFYLRNVALGVDPLALECEATGPRRAASPRATACRGRDSVAALPEPDVERGRGGALPPRHDRAGVRSRWGRGRSSSCSSPPRSSCPSPSPPRRRREAWVVWSQIALEAAFWAIVPYADVRARLRQHPLPAAGLRPRLRRGGRARPRRAAPTSGCCAGLALAVVLQGLLMLHAELPQAVRAAAGARRPGGRPASRSRPRRAPRRGRAGASSPRPRWRSPSSPRRSSPASAPSTAAGRCARSSPSTSRRRRSTPTPGNGSTRTAATARWRWRAPRSTASATRRWGRGLSGGRSTSTSTPPTAARRRRIRAATRGCDPERRGLARQPPPREACAGSTWSATLAADWPIEAKWVHERPERFAVRHADELSVLVEVLPERPAKERPRPGAAPPDAGRPGAPDRAPAPGG